MTNSEKVRSIYEAFDAKDLDRVLAWNAPGAKMSVLGAHWDLSMKDYALNWATAVPDAKCDVVNLIETGKFVVAEFIGRGTHRGNLRTREGLLGPTGMKVELRICEIYEFNDEGKIVAGRSYFDFADLLRQLGIPLGIAPAQKLAAATAPPPLAH